MMFGYYFDSQLTGVYDPFDSGRKLSQGNELFEVQDPQKRAVNFTTLGFSVVAMLCSVLTLLLIRKMGNWNPQIALIWWMSLCQFTYDISFFGYLSQTTSKGVYKTSAFFQLFGGLSVAFFTNVITFVLMYVILSRKNLDVFKYFHIVLLVTLGPSLTVASIYLSKADDIVYLNEYLSPIYYWMRLGSIFLNALFYFITAYTVQKITKLREHRTRTENAIIVITSRSKWYWIIQAISRSGAAVYEQVYGYQGFMGHSSTNQFVSAMFFAVLTPSASIGYLAIFLWMQPGAHQSLLELIFVDMVRICSCGMHKGFVQYLAPNRGGRVRKQPTATKSTTLGEDSVLSNDKGDVIAREIINNSRNSMLAGPKENESRISRMSAHPSDYTMSEEDKISEGASESHASGSEEGLGRIPELSAVNKYGTKSSNAIPIGADIGNMSPNNMVGSSPKLGSSHGSKFGSSQGSKFGSSHGSKFGSSQGSRFGSSPGSKMASSQGSTMVPSSLGSKNSAKSGRSDRDTWTSMLSRSLASDFMANLTGPNTSARTTTSSEGGSNASEISADIPSGMSGLRRNFGSSNFSELIVEELDDDALFEIIEHPDRIDSEQALVIRTSEDVYNELVVSNSWDATSEPSLSPVNMIDPVQPIGSTSSTASPMDIDQNTP